MSRELSPRRTLTIIWGAFIAASVIYVVLGFFVARGMAVVPVAPQLLIGFCVAAVASVALGYVLPPRQLAAALEPGMSADQFLPAYQTAMIVRWACFESVAIYGLVLTIMGGQVLFVTAGAVAALGLLLGARPDIDRFVRLNRTL